MWLIIAGMRFVGIDPSLNATGLCVVGDGAPILLETLTPLRGVTGPERLVWIRDMVADCLNHGDFFAAIEGYNYGVNLPGSRALAELGGVLRVALFEKGVKYVEVPPTTLKKFATGSGRADKAAMIRAAVRMQIEPADDNQADAFHLACLARAFRRETSPTNRAQAEVLKILGE